MKRSRSVLATRWKRRGGTVVPRRSTSDSGTTRVLSKRTQHGWPEDSQSPGPISNHRSSFSCSRSGEISNPNTSWRSRPTIRIERCRGGCEGTVTQTTSPGFGGAVHVRGVVDAATHGVGGAHRDLRGTTTALLDLGCQSITKQRKTVVEDGFPLSLKALKRHGFTSGLWSLATLSLRGGWNNHFLLRMFPYVAQHPHE